MAIKDIVELESKGVAVPMAAPTVQEVQRTRGNFIAGREVPSKRIKSMYRRIKHGGMSMRAWALTLKGDDYNVAQQWFRNKAATG